MTTTEELRQAQLTPDREAQARRRLAAPLDQDELVCALVNELDRLRSTTVDAAVVAATIDIVGREVLKLVSEVERLRSLLVGEDRS